MRLATRYRVPGHVDIEYRDTPPKVAYWLTRIAGSKGVVKVSKMRLDRQGRAYATARRQLPRPPATRSTPPPVAWGQVRWRLDLRPRQVVPLVLAAVGLAATAALVYVVSVAARWAAANAELVVGMLTIALVTAFSITRRRRRRRPARVRAGGGGGRHRCQGHHCPNCPDSR